MFSPYFVMTGLMLLGVGWNLVLATIPCLLSYEIARWKGSRIVFWTAFLLWLFYFPNTAYMFTLVRHLVDHCTNYNIHRVCFEEAYKVPVLFLYALLGLPAFVYSMKQMTSALGRRLPWIILPVTSLGILLGLWERANTWDIVAHPLLLLQKTIGYFLQPIGLWNWFVYTAVLFIIYYGALYLWNQRPK